jgi:hypothetical protein
VNVSCVRKTMSKWFDKIKIIDVSRNAPLPFFYPAAESCLK